MTSPALARAWADDYERRKPNDRAFAMARLYVEEGLTLEEIAEQYGISRQRVGQVLQPFGLQPHFGKRRKDVRYAKLKEALERIKAGSTTQDEADLLGYASRKSFCAALRNSGLRLPKRPLPEHGTLARYWRGCHCAACRKKQANYRREKRHSDSPKEHGTVSAYFNFGCRCPACRAAGSRYQRELRVRRRQALEPVE